MAVDQLNFAATVDKWVQETEQRMTAVFRQSTQELVSRAQARIPIDLGYARASIRASLTAMPPINPAMDNKAGSAGGGEWAGQVALTINGAKLGQTIFIGWVASYVFQLELGHSKQAPTGFVGVTAMEWPNIVAAITAEAKQRVYNPTHGT